MAIDGMEEVDCLELAFFLLMAVRGPTHLVGKIKPIVSKSFSK